MKGCQICIALRKCVPKGHAIASRVFNGYIFLLEADGQRII